MEKCLKVVSILLVIAIAGIAMGCGTFGRITIPDLKKGYPYDVKPEQQEYYDLAGDFISGAYGRCGSISPTVLGGGNIMTVTEDIYNAKMAFNEEYGIDGHDVPEGDMRERWFLRLLSTLKYIKSDDGHYMYSIDLDQFISKFTNGTGGFGGLPYSITADVANPDIDLDRVANKFDDDDDGDCIPDWEEENGNFEGINAEPTGRGMGGNRREDCHDCDEKEGSDYEE